MAVIPVKCSNGKCGWQGSVKTLTAPASARLVCPRCRTPSVVKDDGRAK